MSEYQPLWAYIQKQNASELWVSFDTMRTILGFPIDHAFLNFKKELEPLGYEVGKISLKNKRVQFLKK